MLDMKARFRLVRRGSRGSTFYCFDSVTRKRASLETTDEGEAQRLIHAQNEAQLQLALYLQIARVYLSATDPEVRTRTWQKVMEAMASTKTGLTLVRWKSVLRDKAFDSIRNLPLLETRPERRFLGTAPPLPMNRTSIHRMDRIRISGRTTPHP